MRITAYQAFLCLFIMNYEVFTKDLNCPNNVQFHQAQTTTQLESLTHPICLNLFLETLIKQSYPNYKSWKKSYQILSLGKRLPHSWRVLQNSWAFFLKDQTSQTLFDQSWAFIQNLPENPKAKKALLQLLKEQPHLKKIIQNAYSKKLSPVGQKTFLRVLPELL